MSVITLASSKGGSGKTTVTVGLAIAFARAGLSVGIIDGDPSQNASTWLQVLANSADIPLDGAALEWNHGGYTVARNVTEERMVAVIDGLAASCDIVLIDTQGSANQAMLMAMSRSDLVIIPVQPSRFDTQAAVKTAKIAEQAGRLMRRDIPVRLLMSRTKPAINTTAAKMVRGELVEAGYPLLRVELMDRTPFQKMTITGLAPDLNSRNEAEVNAAKNLEWLAKEVGLVLRDGNADAGEAA